jgi:hypothetical protein
MAHFAKINEENIVEQVIVVDNQYESDGNTYINEVLQLDGTWIQTSYNNTIRGNFAGIGYTYDIENDVFIAPQPFESWLLNENWQWEAPIPLPSSTEPGWMWDEEILNWVNILQ